MYATEECESHVIKNPTPIIFEIENKYWLYNEVVYGVWETHGVRIYRTMAVLPKDGYYRIKEYVMKDIINLNAKETNIAIV